MSVSNGWSALARAGLAIALLAPALAACTTTEEANKAIKSRFIGQPSDVFFSQYGAPLSEFPLNNGGKVYRWRGGETMRTLPAEYTTIGTADPMAGKSTTKTTTTVMQPNSSTTVTETRTTTSGVTFGGMPQQVMVKPARVEALFCEAQISADAGGIITNIEATRDTDGEGFSLSRCAEVFGVKK
ncbi:hypothetical protein C7I85_20750 [Mesorhizobium soli]|uniref:Uncharacterized protein n=2 Tax=Pseudaminobacter soli (ex Li et al. 2025) TaxID=1295366 RepID=A0A2P7S728_9HYPH|nr:hypothetical protein C7I85_20750 [Mesorhizobium soli]